MFTDYDSPMPAFRFSGGERHGVGLLESALALPRQTFDGKYLYRTWHDKAGVLLRSLIKNHPLEDGNKRIALATTFVFLLMNGRFLLADNREMVAFALDVAASEPDMSWMEVARWIGDRCIHSSDVDEVAAKVKAQSPDIEADIEEIRQHVVGWRSWVLEYRRLEAQMRRAWKGEGLDPALMFELLAEVVS